MLNHAIDLLTNLLSNANIDDGHGIDHAKIVMNHARKALEYEQLPKDTKDAILLAALLHDADDRKFFPNNTNHENAYYILNKIDIDQEQVELVIKMIDLVSCSKNRNTHVEPAWLLIPRYADRLEAMGKIGIVRCYQYTVHKNRPLYLTNTPRCYSVEDLDVISPRSRFEQYNGDSTSMMDHFYDKLLHLVDMTTTNEYLLKVARRRHQTIVDFCLDFGKTGKVNIDQIKSWMAIKL